jgi:hypothetical protein
MSMRVVWLSFLLAFVRLCSAQTDTNVIALGEWSPVVRDAVNGAQLRGRLVLYDERCSTNQSPSRVPQILCEHARVYVELQHVFDWAWYQPIEVYFNPSDLPFEMKDAFGKPVSSRIFSMTGVLPEPCWLVLPCDSMVRVRADLYTLGGKPDPAVIEILASRLWKVPRKSTNDYFLSCTFTTETNHPSCLGYHMWRGSLRLPAIRIPTTRP